MTPHTAGFIPPPLYRSYSSVVVAVVSKGRLAWGLPPLLLLLEELGGANGPNPVIRTVKALPAWSSTAALTSISTMHESNPTTRNKNEHSTDSRELPSGIFHELTAFERDILTVLAGLDDPAGVDIRAELNAYYAISVEPSRVYQALTKLADNSLVDISEQDARTNAYQLSTRGERVLAAGRGFQKTMAGGEADE